MPPKSEDPPLTADGLKEAIGILAAMQDATQEDIEVIDWTTPEPWTELKERAMERNREIMARHMHDG